MNRLFFLLFFTWLTFDVWAQTSYKCYVAGRVDEVGGHEYGFYGPSDSFDEELFFGLNQQKGQKLYWNKQGNVVEASADNKYIAGVAIIETGEESFDAVITLYATSANSKSDDTTGIATHEIGKYSVNGHLNAKNEYQFIDDGKHSFYLKIEIDKHFTTEEKMARLLKKQARHQD